MFFQSNKALLLASAKIKSTRKLRAHHRRTFDHSHPPYSSCMMSYKDYDQTKTTPQYSINQRCSESVKFDSSELISVLQRHVKKSIDRTSLMHDCLLFG